MSALMFEQTEHGYTVTAEPDHAPAVTLFVSYGEVEVPGRSYRRRRRRSYWRVSRDEAGARPVVQHTSEMQAVHSAISRAKRYIRAYDKPRGLAR